MKNNVKLMNLEARIEVLERELRNLKEEVKALKENEVSNTSKTESVATTEAKTNVKAEDVFATTIEELDLSIRAFNCLKRAGINTLGDLAVMSDD